MRSLGRPAIVMAPIGVDRVDGSSVDLDVEHLDMCFDRRGVLLVLLDHERNVIRSAGGASGGSFFALLDGDFLVCHLHVAFLSAMKMTSLLWWAKVTLLDFAVSMDMFAWYI